MSSYLDYTPNSYFNFSEWKYLADTPEIKTAHETLHQELLYINVRQDCNVAVSIFEKMSIMLSEIGTEV